MGQAVGPACRSRSHLKAVEERGRVTGHHCKPHPFRKSLGNVDQALVDAGVNIHVIIVVQEVTELIVDRELGVDQGLKGMELQGNSGIGDLAQIHKIKRRTERNGELKPHRLRGFRPCRCSRRSCPCPGIKVGIGRIIEDHIPHRSTDRRDRPKLEGRPNSRHHRDVGSGIQSFRNRNLTLQAFACVVIFLNEIAAKGKDRQLGIEAGPKGIKGERTALASNKPQVNLHLVREESGQHVEIQGKRGIDLIDRSVKADKALHHQIVGPRPENQRTLVRSWIVKEMVPDPFLGDIFPKIHVKFRAQSLHQEKIGIPRSKLAVLAQCQGRRLGESELDDILVPPVRCRVKIHIFSDHQVRIVAPARNDLRGAGINHQGGGPGNFRVAFKQRPQINIDLIVSDSGESRGERNKQSL